MNMPRAGKISILMPALLAPNETALPNDRLRTCGYDEPRAATTPSPIVFGQNSLVCSVPNPMSRIFDGAIQHAVQLQSP